MKEFTNPYSNISSLLDSERHFLEALTRWNYFPNQKNQSTELPPCFSTRLFTPEIADVLSKIPPAADRNRLGFDLTEYKATRFNNIPRILGLIHPLAYSQIFKVLKTHREEILQLMEDKNSAITAEQHNDGRMFIMNYEDHERKTKKTLHRSFGAAFRVHADVANCFGSIYTHSLEWAIQGYDKTKSNLNKKGPNHWSCDFDKSLRRAKRNETVGLPIGPSTSSIAVEIILATVDKELTKKNFQFVRYIDDYTAYCSTHQQAQEFILALSVALSQYRLTLNLNKTKIVELPEPLVDSWVTKINNAVPWKKDANGNVSLNTRDAIRFLDYAVHLKRAEPDGSVLKLAAGLICSRVHGDTAATVFQYILNLSWHYPILLPLLEKIDISPERHDTLSLVEKLNSILKVNTEHRRSDGMCWALYYIKLLKEEPSQVNIERILETQDATTIALLSNFENGKADAISYANKVIETGDLYDRDRHWILLYELFFRGEINNPYPQEPAFEILKKYDVQFIYPPERRSEAENYCFYYSSPFRKPGEIRLSFQEYLDNNI